MYINDTYVGPVLHQGGTDERPKATEDGDRQVVGQESS